jgi:hypothetical protein
MTSHTGRWLWTLLSLAAALVATATLALAPQQDPAAPSVDPACGRGPDLAERLEALASEVRILRDGLAVAQSGAAPGVREPIRAGSASLDELAIEILEHTLAFQEERAAEELAAVASEARRVDAGRRDFEREIARMTEQLASRSLDARERGHLEQARTELSEQDPGRAQAAREPLAKREARAQERLGQARRHTQELRERSARLRADRTESDGSAERRSER